MRSAITVRVLAAAALLACVLLLPLRAGADDSASDLVKAGKVKIDEFNDQADPNAKPVDGGALIIRFNSEPKLLSAELDNSAVTSYICGLIYETLIEKDPETFEYIPLGCERFVQEDLVVTADGKELRGAVTEEGDKVTVKPATGGPATVAKSAVKEIRRGASITFHMKKGATWHDGKPVTAKDVLFSYRCMQDPHVLCPQVRSYLTDVSNVELIDDMTIRYTYAQQYWKALGVAGAIHFLLPEHVFNADGLLEKDPKAFGERFNNDPRHREPIGSGPYVFDHFRTGVEVGLKRNPSYVGTWKPHLDRITYRFITDNIAALQALKNGEVDFVPDITPEMFHDEEKNANTKKDNVLVKYFVGNYNYVGWNNRKAPFNDKMVRRAMAYACLDKDEFNRTVLWGDAVSVEGDQYYFGPAYDRSIKPYPHDLAKAEELLTEAGWFDRDGDGIRDKDGVAFKFELLFPTSDANAPPVRRAAIMTENLKKIGIEMTPRMLEWPAFVQRIEKADFDACQLGWAMDPEEDPFQNWHSSQTGENGSNSVGFVNEEADKLIVAARREIDAKKRWALIAQFQKLLHEEQPYFILFCGADYNVYKKRFRGVKVYKLRPGYDLRDWWLPKEFQQ